MGFEVVALYSSDESAAQTAKKQLPDVRFLRADVSDEQRMREVFAEIGPIDVLVNNAGIDAFAQVQDMSYSDYHRVMDVNMGCSRHALPRRGDRQCLLRLGSSGRKL